jgi:phosphoglycolate phosphatase-like HAD superfamily hydrolase
MKPVSAVLFDFDGTFSTLRNGWEGVMLPLMLEVLGADQKDAVASYIGESTGIQTIKQMKWLAGEAEKRHGYAKDPWEYKAEYNRRLMEVVSRRREALRDGSESRGDYLIAGSVELLEALRGMGVEMFVASGTDDPDVKEEVAALGLSRYFTRVAGAPAGREDCSKEGVIRELLDAGVSGDGLAVVGDGKVEIMIGRENGARTLGLASDEGARRGIDDRKRERLIKAGADIITGDFLDLDMLMAFFGFRH